MNLINVWMATSLGESFSNKTTSFYTLTLAITDVEEKRHNPLDNLFFFQISSFRDLLDLFKDKILTFPFPGGELTRRYRIDDN